MANLRSAERRFTPGTVELRSENTRTISGYAAKFDRLSQDLGGFVERIDKRFFNKSKGDGWPGVLARYNHQDHFLLGTTRAGTLRLEIDGEGLRYEVDTPMSRQDVFELVQRGDVAQSSFAFRVSSDGDEWARSEEGYPMRTLLRGQLVDVAPVNSPAYLDTSVSLMGLAKRAQASLDEVRAAAEAGELLKFLPGTPATVIDLGARASVEATQNYSLKGGDTPAPSVEHPDHEEPPKENAGRDSVPDLTEATPENPEYTGDSDSERQDLHSNTGHRWTRLRMLELQALEDRS